MTISASNEILEIFWDASFLQILLRTVQDLLYTVLSRLFWWFLSAFGPFGIIYLKISLQGVKWTRLNSRDESFSNWFHKKLIESTQVPKKVPSFFTDIWPHFLSASFQFLIRVISRGSHKIQNMTKFFRWPYLSETKFWNNSEMLLFSKPFAERPGICFILCETDFSNG